MTNRFLYDTQDPFGPQGTTVSVYIPGYLIERMYTKEPVNYENFRAVKEVLDRPLRIFRGVRHDQQGSWCYCGRPLQWCVRPNVFADFPEHLVFSVYLNSNRAIYHFRAELGDPEDADAPLGWRDRYEGLVWKSTF